MKTHNLAWSSKKSHRRIPLSTITQLHHSSLIGAAEPCRHHTTIHDAKPSCEPCEKKQPSHIKHLYLVAIALCKFLHTP
ncbi:hypothetical protein VIGAN_05208500 [Vigna angularis var. angularis]|uniref:Uncharacterized protein n=1 Tax=Vigna angularis var. angularis TaxID=157739 RepID=A0A0S3S6U7_PHAAN|nr:hypothetical protein VIGAN_05208500 [Vigna angularis var. angularis]